MSTSKQSIIKAGLFGGLLYAGFMALVGYRSGEDMVLLQFIINAVVMGIAFGTVQWFFLRKKVEKN